MNLIALLVVFNYPCGADDFYRTGYQVESGYMIINYGDNFESEMLAAETVLKYIDAGHNVAIFRLPKLVYQKPYRHWTGSGGWKLTAGKWIRNQGLVRYPVDTRSGK